MEVMAVSRAFTKSSRSAGERSVARVIMLSIKRLSIERGFSEPQAILFGGERTGGEPNHIRNHIQMTRVIRFGALISIACCWIWQARSAHRCRLERHSMYPMRMAHGLNFR